MKLTEQQHRAVSEAVWKYMETATPDVKEALLLALDIIDQEMMENN
jgi:hypothetical protein